MSNFANPISFEHLETYAEQQARLGNTATDSHSNNPNSNETNSNNNIDLTNPFVNDANINKQDVANRANQNNSANNDSANQAKQPTLDEIVNAKDFGEINDDLFNKALNGDASGFKDTFATITRNVYKQAITDANALMEAKLSKLKNEIKANIESDKKVDNLVNTMKNELAFTKDPAIEPVARQVFAGYIRKGLNTEEALGATRQYFSNLTKSFNAANKKPDEINSNSNVLTGEDALNRLFS